MPQKQPRINWKKLSHTKEFWYIVGGIIFAIALIVAELVVYYCLRYNRPEDYVSFSSELWRDKYLSYLDQIIKNEQPNDKLKLDYMSDVEVALYHQTGWQSAVMVISYRSKLNDKNYTNFVTINKDSSELATLNLAGQYEVRHYYNMIDQAPNYYTIESGVSHAFSCFVPLAVRAQLGSAENDVDGAICTVHTAADVAQPSERKAASYLFDEVFVPLKEYQNSLLLDHNMSSADLGKQYDKIVEKLGTIQANTNQEVTNLDAKITAAQKRAEAQNNQSADQPE